VATKIFLFCLEREPTTSTTTTKGKILVAQHLWLLVIENGDKISFCFCSHIFQSEKLRKWKRYLSFEFD
jgi:hypothetical protein